MPKGLRIIDEDERLVFGSMKSLGFEIEYRRIPNTLRNSIAKRYTRIAKRGIEVTDWGPASLEMLQYIILGWCGFYKIVDGKEGNVPYSSETIQFIPDDIQTEILELSGANVERTESDIKNLKSTRDNKLPMKD